MTEPYRRLSGAEIALPPESWTDAIEIIEAHAPHMSDGNEQEIADRRWNSDTDRFGQQAFEEADLALRTCRCGIRIDGFDEYVFHLKSVFNGTAISGPTS